MIEWYIALPLAWVWVICGYAYGKHVARTEELADVRLLNKELREVIADIRAQNPSLREKP